MTTVLQHLVFHRIPLIGAAALLFAAMQAATVAESHAAPAVSSGTSAFADSGVAARGGDLANGPVGFIKFRPTPK